MNRNEEYIDLMNELEGQAPSLGASVAKAKKRKMVKQIIWRPMGTVAAMLTIFVILVNCCSPMAYAALAKVPVLGDLAEAVKFSKSLSDAVENEYIQTVGLTQTKDGVTAEIAYLIADEKQTNIFYRVSSDVYTELGLRSHVKLKETGSYGASGHEGEAEGDLNCWSVNFGGETPESFIFELKVFDSETAPIREENSITTFNFDLEVDKELMGAAKIYNVDKTIGIDGHEITITNVEVYPTHTRVRVKADASSTADIMGLDFYINTDKGTKFEAVSSGTTMSSSSKDGISFYGDSMYFYDVEPVELVITDVEWEIEWKRKPILDLVTGECKYLPDWIELVSVERNDNSCVVSFKAKYGEEKSDYFLFFDNISYKSYSGSFDERVTKDCGDGYFMEILTINDYPYDEFILLPAYEYTWTPSEEIVIPLQ